jgi:hypothetical protein
MKPEEWRPIHLGHLGLRSDYEVSNRGRVRNVKTRHLLKTWLGKNRDGTMYERIGLCHCGVRYRRLIHRLVAIAFIPNPEHKAEVNHGDDNTLNNREDNLEWATREENEAHKRFMRATA